MKQLVCLLSVVLGLSLVTAAYSSVPTPIIDLGFNENAGTVAVNDGSAGGELTLTTPMPIWSDNVPAGAGGAGSVDFGTALGEYCVESPDAYSELTGLTRLTVTGWVNCRDSAEGSGGNRLVTWINHGGEGVDVVYKSDGSVQVGINQWPDGVPARSSGGKIPTDAGAGAANWRFFAVTYDSTLGSGQVKFYFGSSADEAAFDVEIDYDRGAVGSNISRLCVGHFNIATRPGRQDRMFRGLIDEVKVFGEALALEQIQEVQFGHVELAGRPTPEDKATDVLRDVTLEWEPGAFAASHNVYFGTSWDDVNNASLDNPLDVLASEGQDVNALALDPLEYGRTYYWRIDEVNSPPDSTVFKGGVWSFTVEPRSYALPLGAVSATASSASAAPSQPPVNTIDGSGLDDSDQHASDTSTMWLSAPDDAAPWIQFELNELQVLDRVQVWNHNTQTEAVLGFGMREALIETSADGENWTEVGTVEIPQAPGNTAYTGASVDLGDAVAKYVRISPQSNWSALPSITQKGLSEVRFYAVPMRARLESPESGTADLDPLVDLNWRAGRAAAGHEVLTGTDPDALSLAATVEAPAATIAADLDSTVYWRVNEVNEAADPSVWEGPLWSFQTAAFLTVDDMESYDSQDGSWVWETWLDGYEDDDNGALLGHGGDNMERDAVYEGAQSLPYYYGQGGAAVSEASREIDRNWGRHGIVSISLMFRGVTSNVPGQMYLKINGEKIAVYPVESDLAIPQWQAWTIDLPAGALGQVDTLALGFEGGTGHVFIDAIRLYARPAELLAPVDPGAEGLLVEYTFDNDASDSSGNGYHGTLLDEANVAAGKLVLDGTDDAVAMPRLGGDAATFSQCTYSMWLYSTVDPASHDNVGGINSDGGWSSGKIHCKISRGHANTGINGLAGGDLQGSSVVDIETWVHLALTVSDDQAVIYLNGRQEDSRSFESPLTMILGAASVGAWNNNGDIVRELTGQMDDIRIYDRALSEEEILWLAGRRDAVYKPF